MTMTLGRGQLYLQAPADHTVRHGGFEFALDTKKGLWVAPTLADAFGNFSVNLGHAISYTISGWNCVEAAPAAPPATASPLWDKPETVTGEIIAYRGWDYDFHVTPDGKVAVRLESRHQDFYWDGPATTADEAPSAEGDHGLYAVASDAHHKDNFGSYVSDAPIWGRVALSGVVVEGTNGYRAERAAVQELWVNAGALDCEDSADGMCKALGDRYQCDVSVKAPRWADIATA